MVIPFTRRETIAALGAAVSWLGPFRRLFAAQAPQPKAKAKARREPPTIPDVPRDRLIGFCLYTTHRGILKLTAQLYPLQDGEERAVRLAIQDDEGGWHDRAVAEVDPMGWMATFRLEGWDDTAPRRYRVAHAGGSTFEGLVRRNPVDKDEIVVASLSCNGNDDRSLRPDIVANLKAQDPDLLFFAGDQSYDHREHTAAWLLFGRQFGELMKDRPTITIPDDHDVGHPNLWGAAGKKSDRPDGADGGYYMPVEYVNMVQKAQTSHLPDPVDPTPVERGITVYYTSLNVGGIDFAILEDRKWKTGPLGLVPPQGPRPDHITSPDFDPATIDLPEAELLGRRQLDFLRSWAQDWQGSVLKVALSQTIFGGGAHLHGSRDNRLIADLDSNGWPQSGRDAALREIRRCFALMLGGDQHLATVIHHGINDWEDAGLSFCSPSISNIYRRWWWPLEPPAPGGPAVSHRFGGRHRDGFGNKLTMLAYANPEPEHPMATGYGLVRLRKSSRTITLECWPRGVDATRPDAKQFEGWPITVRQLDNYGRPALAWLPTLVVRGQSDPVVQVVDEAADEVVYTLRIQGDTFRPKVFRAGTYTVHVGEGDRRKTIRGLQAVAREDASRLEVDLGT